jgi:hypothetical protein
MFAYNIERLDTWVWRVSIAIPALAIVVLVLLNLGPYLFRKLFPRPARPQLAPQPSLPPVILGARPAADAGGSAPERISAILPTTVAPRDPERNRQARELFALARDDFRRQQFASCLDKCRTLAERFADLPEGVQAKDLADRIKDDPQLLERACLNLGHALADGYLELAESWKRQGQDAQAASVLHKLIRTLPETNQAQAARARLGQWGYPLTDNEESAAVK